jgi:alpha-L-rhamnosidase
MYWAKATYQSPRGPISCHWKKENGRFILDVQIPAGATATVKMPVVGNEQVMDDEMGIPAANSEGITATEHAVFQLQSGIYRLSVPMSYETNGMPDSEF